MNAPSHSGGTPSGSPTPRVRCQCGYLQYAQQRCPECGREFAEPPAPNLALHLWAFSITTFVCTNLVAPQFLCGCGNFSAGALPYSSSLLVLSLWSYILARRRYLTLRLAAAIAVVAAAMFFGMNVCDVLWFGHTPLL